MHVNYPTDIFRHPGYLHWHKCLMPFSGTKIVYVNSVICMNTWRVDNIKWFLVPEKSYCVCWPKLLGMMWRIFPEDKLFSNKNAPRYLIIIKIAVLLKELTVIAWVTNALSLKISALSHILLIQLH